MKQINAKNIKKAFRDPMKGYRHFKKWLKDKRYNKVLKEGYFSDDPDAFDRYLKEFQNSGIVSQLDQKARDFKQKVKGRTERGQSYGMGTMNIGSGSRLYSLIRKQKPLKIVETGVCNGASTSYILLALAHNEKGTLYSIDLPEREGGEGPDHWEGKGGSVIPREKEPGWMVPEHLRDRWEFREGKSQEVLPPLLEELGEIDTFIHDSEHSYECMTFEFKTAWEYLNEGGLLLSHDIDVNTAFEDMVQEQGMGSFLLDDNLGVMMTTRS